MKFEGRSFNGFPHKLKVVLQFFEQNEPLETFAELTGMNPERNNMIEYVIRLSYSQVVGRTIQEVYLVTIPYNSYISIMVKDEHGSEKTYS